MADMGTDSAQMAIEMLKGVIRIGIMLAERIMPRAFKYGKAMAKGCFHLGTKGAKAVAHAPGKILKHVVDKEKHVRLEFKSVEEAAINRAAMLDRFDFKSDDIEQIGNNLVVHNKKLFEKKVDTPNGTIEMMRGLDGLAKDKDRYNQVVKEAESGYEEFQKECMEYGQRGDMERGEAEPALGRDNPYLNIDKNRQALGREEVRDENNGRPDKVSNGKTTKKVDRNNPYAKVTKNSKREAPKKARKSLTSEHNSRNAAAAKAKSTKSQTKSHTKSAR